MSKTIDITSIEQKDEDPVSNLDDLDELFGDDFFSDAQEIIDSLIDSSES
jgi:hypothetical protein